MQWLFIERSYKSIRLDHLGSQFRRSQDKDLNLEAHLYFVLHSDMKDKKVQEKYNKHLEKLYLNYEAAKNKALQAPSVLPGNVRVTSDLFIEHVLGSLYASRASNPQGLKYTLPQDGHGSDLKKKLDDYLDQNLEVLDIDYYYPAMSLKQERSTLAADERHKLVKIKMFEDYASEKLTEENRAVRREQLSTFCGDDPKLQVMLDGMNDIANAVWGLSIHADSILRL